MCLLSSFGPYGSCSAFLKVLWMIPFILYLRDLLILSKLLWKLFFSALYTSRNWCNSFQKCMLLYSNSFFFLLVLPLSLCFVSSCLTSLSLPCFSITVDHRHHILLPAVPMKNKDKSFDFCIGAKNSLWFIQLFPNWRRRERNVQTGCFDRLISAAFFCYTDLS